MRMRCKQASELLDINSSEEAAADAVAGDKKNVDW
jgi:hypothetical protein